MKASRYNFFFKEDGLLFNAVTCGLAQVLPENVDLIEKVLENPCENNLSALDPDIKEKLIEGGFLIEDDVDELAFLEARYHLAQFAPDILSLTIVPTLNCNFRCVYCFEEKLNLSMGDSVIESIISFIQSRDNLKRLTVTWYGGEPLLEQDTILALSEKVVNHCNNNNIKFRAGIVTNGYLLTPSLAKLLAEKARVEWIQITLDGPPDIHNKRRPLKGGGATFDTIISNLLAAVNLFRVAVRVNVDKNNVLFIPNLINILDEIGLKQRIMVAPGRVSAPTIVCKDYMQNCFDPKTYSNLQFQIYKTLSEFGFQSLIYPKLVTIPCISVSPFFFVIGPKGELYKCWETVGIEKEVVGYLDNPKVLTPNSAKWLNYNPLKFKNCKRCNVLPICMGSCPYHQIQKYSWLKPSDNCPPWKYNLKDYLFYVAANINDLYSKTEGG